MAPALRDRVEIEAALHRWEGARLIAPSEVAAILSWEERREGAPAPAAAAAVLAGITLIEVLVYAAVLVGLTGVLIVLFGTEVGYWARGIVLAAVAVGTAGAGIALERRGDLPGRRGGAAALALAAAASGGAVTQFLEAAGWLMQRAEMPAGPPEFTTLTVTVDNGGAAIAVGALVSVVLAAVVIARHRIELPPALVAAAAAYIGAGSLIDALQFTRQTDLPHPVPAALLAAAGCALLALSALASERFTHHLLEGVAVAITAIVLYGFGGSPDLELDVIGGVVATVAMVAGTAMGRAGMAVGGAVGVAGLVVDIGARTFETPMAVGVFLVLAALVALVLILAMRFVFRRRGGRTA